MKLRTFVLALTVFVLLAFLTRVLALVPGWRNEFRRGVRAGMRDRSRNLWWAGQTGMPDKFPMKDKKVKS